jgi:predicted dehydrogenase
VSRIGVAVIGYGLAGSVFHAPLVAANPDLEVRAIVTANPERRRRAGRDFPEARLLTTPDQLWNDSSGIGLVVVATPNHLHAPQAITALGLGLAAVVDKPMALSTAEAGTMLEAAERSSGVLSVFKNRRWDSDFLLLRETLESDRLGGLLRLESRFERFRPEVKSSSWREATTPEAGGGLLLDLGAHLIDQALFLLGQPRGVYAEIPRPGLPRRRPGPPLDEHPRPVDRASLAGVGQPRGPRGLGAGPPGGVHRGRGTTRRSRLRAAGRKSTRRAHPRR